MSFNAPKLANVRKSIFSRACFSRADELVVQLKDAKATPNVRAAAAQAMGKLAPPPSAALDALYPILADEDLGRNLRIRTAEAIGSLASQFEDGSPQHKRAVKALYDRMERGGEDSEDVLIVCNDSLEKLGHGYY